MAFTSHSTQCKQSKTIEDNKNDIEDDTKENLFAVLQEASDKNGISSNSKSMCIKYVNEGSSEVSIINRQNYSEFYYAYLNYANSRYKEFLKGDINGFIKMSELSSMSLYSFKILFESIPFPQKDLNPDDVDKIGKIISLALRSYITDNAVYHLYYTSGRHKIRGEYHNTIEVHCPNFSMEHISRANIYETIRNNFTSSESTIFGVKASLMNRYVVESKQVSYTMPWTLYSSDLTNDAYPMVPLLCQHVIDTVGNGDRTYFYTNLKNMLNPTSNSVFAASRPPKVIELSQVSYASSPNCDKGSTLEISNISNINLVTSAIMPILSYSYNEIPEAITRPVSLSNLFANCSMDIKSVPNLTTYIAYLNNDRFDMYTSEGLADLLDIVAVCTAFNMMRKPGQDRGSTQASSFIRAVNYVESIIKKKGIVFDRNEFNRIYNLNKMTLTNKKSFKTIYSMLQRDAPGTYLNILGETIWAKLHASIKPTCDSPIASALAFYLQMTHFYSFGGSKGAVHLYEFTNGIYEERPDPVVHISYLLTDAPVPLSRILDLYENRLISLMSRNNDDITSEVSLGPDTSNIELRRKNIRTFIENLSVSTFKKKLANSIQSELYSVQTSSLCANYSQMDTAINITSCLNGTFVVTKCYASDDNIKKKIIFREARPDDMTTKAFQANFNPNIVKDKTWVILTNYLEQILPSNRDHGVLDWFLTYMAGSFYGQNNKLACFLVGTGDSGKTTLISIFNKLFGPHSNSLPANALSDEKMTQDAPQVATHRAVSSRFTSLEETSDHIRDSNFKIFFGGGSLVPFRSIYEKGESGIIACTALFAMNKMPKFTSIDKAIENRACPIVFNTVFASKGSHNIPDTEAERSQMRIYKKERGFEDRLNECLDALLFLLFQRFDNYKGIDGQLTDLSDIPAKMRKWRDNMLALSPVGNFKVKHLSIKLGAKLTLKDAMAAYLKSCSGKSKLSEVDFIEALDSLLVSKYAEGYGWKNIKLRDSENEDEQDEQDGDDSDSDDDSESVESNDSSDSSESKEYGILYTDDEDTDSENKVNVPKKKDMDADSDITPRPRAPTINKTQLQKNLNRYLKLTESRRNDQRQSPSHHDS
jgi:hypothetical protein